jgi:hypothetical protein
MQTIQDTTGATLLCRHEMEESDMCSRVRTPAGSIACLFILYGVVRRH